MEKQVSKGQIGTMVALLVAGKVPRDEAQAFIDKYKDAPSAKKRKKVPERSDIVKIWGERYPWSAKQFKELMGALYETPLELKPVVNDLEARLHDSLQWMEATGIRLVHFCEAAGLERMSNSNPFAGKGGSIESDALGNDYSDWFIDVAYAPIRDDFHRMLGVPLWDSLEDDPSRLSILDTLYEPSEALVAGQFDQTLKFKPVIDLWLAGNFPVALDEDSKLLVLVAD